MFSRRRLPHLNLPGHPQFVTFHLHGTHPSHNAYADLTSGQAFLHMDRQLDSARIGAMWLRQPPVARAVRDCILRGAQLDRFRLHAWVVMPNHVHLLITPAGDLSAILRSLKAKSALEANRILNRTGQPFWQDESYDHLVRNAEEFRSITLYIEHNPVKAALAATPESYPWSSATRPVVQG